MKNIVGIVVLLAVLTLPFVQSVPSYPCDVQSCEYCSYYNTCGVCKTNYILRINMTTSQTYCAQIYCVENCVSCLSNYFCQECTTGYYLTSQGYCSSTKPSVTTCSDNCLACNSSDWCTLCSYGYNIQNGRCVSNVPLSSNCMAGFYPNMCQVCQKGYMINMAYSCMEVPTFSCNVTNCWSCSSNNFCEQCLSGYSVNTNGGCTKLSCNVSNCASCSSSSTCSACSSGYQITNNTCVFKTYECDIENCITCQSSGICAQCNAGYQAMMTKSEGKVVGSYCMQYTAASGYNSQLVQYCKTYGYLIPMTSTALSVGCIECWSNFINVGGFCVANLTQSNYTCNVQNCVYCVQNNYCGKCGDGYTLLTQTSGQCWKTYSPIPNCQITTLIAPVCFACNDGYALNSFYECMMISNVTCKVNGCNYCLTSNVCWECRPGFTKKNDSGTISCTADCTIENCYTCSSSTTCEACMVNYVLNDENTACQLATDVAGDCSTYPNCKNCNAAYCTECSTNYTLNPSTNSCCLTPAQNEKGCALYEDVCSKVCTKCAKGYYKLLGTCISLPCSIDNCEYCFAETSCTVCKEGYNFENGKCVTYTSNNCTLDNCIECNSNNTCKQCLTGYRLYNGYCVCNFQNCLSCMGNSFCKMCAFPTIQTYINFPGCLPTIVPFTQCNVANCNNCKAPNMCSECFSGFSLLANGTCQKNTCSNSSNCATCSADRSICFECKPSYIQSQVFSGQCIKLSDGYECQVSGCQVCNTSTTCETCVQTFTKTSDHQCRLYNCVDNCLICFADDSCTLCKIGFYYSTDNTCVQNSSEVATCDIEYCISCSFDEPNNQTVCDACYLGLQPSEDQLSCTTAQCNIPNCQFCFPGEEVGCLFCSQEYYLNSYLQCVKYSPAINTVSCSVYNCFYCYEENQCGFCAPGWNTTDGICQTNMFCSDDNCEYCTNSSYCVSCVSKYELVLGACKPQCNISNCFSCASLTTCSQCDDTFILSTNKQQCNCKESYVIVSGACACPSNSTEHDNVCYSCNITNCSVCNANNTCLTCADTYYLNDNKCGCADSSFEIVNGKCACPTGTLPFGTGANQKCITCDVKYCSSCSSDNVCSACLTTFNLDNNTCVCDDTFQIIDSVCACPQNYKNFSNTCIQCDIQYCQQCKTTNSCSQCMDSFEKPSNDTCSCPTGTTLYDSYCYTCDLSYCLTCSANNFCEQCDTTFTLDNGTCSCGTGYTLYNSKCVQCNVSNCTTCQTANQCSLCVGGYTLSNKICIECDVRGCSKCSTPNYCETCLNNEHVSSLGTCINCNVAGCNRCSSNTTCVSCNDGLVFNQNKTMCVNCTIVGCAYCSSNNTCSKCLPGFTASGSQTCSVCAYPCKTCNSNGCATCMSPYSLNANSTGFCYLCNVRYCDECSSSSKSTCSQCQSGFSLTTNGTCQRICGGTYCLECQSSTNCTKCMDGYTPNGAGCTACTASNCLQCLSTQIGTCSKCGEGYYLNDGICQSCSLSNCLTCNSTTCLTFKNSTRQLPFINNQGKIVPALCNPECMSCSTTNPEICLICYSGYSLQNGNCVPCSAPCKTCTDNDETSCLSCYSNAYLSNSQCKTCTTSSNCLTCSESSPAKCTSCPYGYYFVSGNSTCSKGCPDFCQACESSTVCTVCQPGYSANSQGKCLPCLSNCRKCSGSQQALCLECGSGFYLNSNSVCTSCPEFCLTCSPDEKCQACVPGYTLTLSFTCTQNCQSPCATCSSTDITKCNSCLAGYSLDSTTSTCSPVTSSNCQNGVCDICAFGYVLSGGNCLQCNTTSNCARCSATNTSVCKSCMMGNYLSSNGCVACPKGCETCSSGTNCLTCKSGYTAQNSPVETTVNCIPCGQPCAQCLGNSYTCTSCMTGFQLVGWKCLSNFNYGFNVTLNTNLTNFYSKYDQFLTAIAQSQDTPQINVTTLTSITTGSVIVKGNVTTLAQSNSNEASTEFNNLNSVLSSEDIAGMPITSYSTEANGGEIPSSNSGPNLAIILGVCIPVGIILIGLIIYCACVRKGSAPQSDYSEKNMEPGTTVRQTFELSRDNTQRIEVQEEN